MWLKKDYKAVSYVLFSCVGGLIFMRLVVYFAGAPSETYAQELGNNALFALVTQLIFFLTVPFCIYKFYGNRTVKETLSFSSIGRFKAYYLLAVPLGISVYFLTVGISSAWTGLLKATGYTVASSSPDMPETFVFGFFVAEIILTALLPAICEEFSMRGGLLTTAQNSFKNVWCIVLCAVIFGLFHQNIRQVFYTSLFGALAAYLTIRTKSLYPAMLMHFTNNFFSVYISYADNYGWAVGGGFYALLGSMPAWAVALVFLIFGAFGAAMLVLMMYVRDRSAIKQKTELIKQRALIAQKRAAMQDETDAEIFADLQAQAERSGYSPQRYKPSLREAAPFIALGVVTLLTTVFTYVWGFFY